MPNAEDPVVPTYPVSASDDGKEGWVRFDFMVSPEGKAYEIALTDHVGDDAFIRAAREALEQTQFTPAMVGDRAVDGSATLVYQFMLSGGPGAARQGFANRYRRFMSSLNEGSQAEASADLAVLEDADAAKNYEYAYLSLARYNFAARYGTAEEQLLYLQNALGESAYQPELEGFLPEEIVTPSRRALFALMVRNGHFAEALDVWKLMGDRGDEEGLASFRPAHDQLLAFRENDDPYAVAAQLDENGLWRLSLFKDDFYLDEIMGAVDQLKLRCERDFVSLAFDPETQYSVADGAGNCSLEATGTPGTTFRLVQL